MKYSKRGAVLLSACLLLTGFGCSKIKSYFPDKEKDYQFKTEIPELVLPPDLGQHTTVKASSVDVTAASPDRGAPQEPAAELIVVERIIYDGGANRLRIDQSLTKTWRIVGKALARESVEIVARNKPEGMYIVMYDPTEEKVTDDSLWDEVLFIFGQRSGKEQEYRIKLAEYDSFTEVIVLDENNNPQSEGPGLALLQLLQNTIAVDGAEQQQGSAQSDKF